MWLSVKDKLLPENETVIALVSYESHGEERATWLCIGKVDPVYKHLLPEFEYRTNVITTAHIGVHCITWWHPIPSLPRKEDGCWVYNQDEWISCENFPPPSLEDDPLHFILFDEIDGIAEAEFWGRYQSDTVSCKYYFEKPLFWRPFPRLPIKASHVLQW